ncbi:PTS sugar transporter subunit IIA [Nitrospina gracilis]|uniref:PTS sugar transporter subunit IIA n=1 Tax=Nitrospina gracilis TaxID=35801 RepID=UPI001F319972|nr:PTS sugar transporter subunit IIA [Nitrospina gracilis]MCF8721278.1 PTS system nitrogen regulatory IIA component [Nitrospina gracilis Nb-211]
MRLNIRETAKLLGVSEKTIYRWVGDGKIPHYRVSDQYRFSRSEILAWAMANRVSIAPEIFLESEEEIGPLPSLTQSLEAGGIVYRLEGKDRNEVLRSMVRNLRLPSEIDRDFVYELILVRETLGSTGIGDGIALPHPRIPLIHELPQPLITLCFLDQSVDFRALDGKPVYALFCILSSTVRGHIHILSRISHALQDPEFRTAILQEKNREAILAELSRVEDKFQLA